MIGTYDFLKSVIDTITDHIVVIDNKGVILFANKGWKSFGQENECLIKDSWSGVNYLQECDNAANMGDDFGLQAATGIRSVIKEEKETFYYEYPCHSPYEKRWFMMRATPFVIKGEKAVVISHQNITERKRAEEEVLKLSRIDALTNIPNRRYFNEFLDSEWKRCRRLNMPISLLIIDLDHFKLLNDTYGHQAGDEFLKLVAKVLTNFVKRPGDICARYGGDEFVIVYGDTSLDHAQILISKLLHEICSLKVPNQDATTQSILTASIGVATMYPNKQNSENDLIKKADKSLYSAKENGRNKVAFC